MQLTGFLVVAPSTVTVGETFQLGLKALCKPYFVGSACYRVIPQLVGRYNVSPRGITYMDNVPPDWKGRVELRGEAGYDGPTELVFDGKQGTFPGDKRPIYRVQGLRFTEPGLKFITVRDPNTGVSAVSNPILVSEQPPAERLFWGDIHSQTIFSDGLRCPEELYSFARDEAFLDIFALADHSESLTDRQWEYFVGVTNDFNRPGSFATLVGFEWTNSKLGHRNVYYPGDAGPILRCTDPVQGQLSHVFEVARKHRALVIPHHSANVTMGVDWSLGHDPEVERLAEIYSIWGNSERLASAGNSRPIRNLGGEKPGQHVLDALKLGRKFGLIGGGDIHDGRPGDDLHVHQNKPEQYKDLWRQGVMGVWAKELTREAIFEALWNRRVYATTNVRVYLEFSVCGAPMGSVITERGRRPIRVRTASESPIAAIELVRNGGDWLRHQPNQRDVVWEVEDRDFAAPAWYYARATRADGEMAWSSPVWVEL